MRLHIKVKASNCIGALVGSAILAFGLYHVHSFSGVTEGGILGLIIGSKYLQQYLDLY